MRFLESRILKCLNVESANLLRSGNTQDVEWGHRLVRVHSIRKDASAITPNAKDILYFTGRHPQGIAL